MNKRWLFWSVSTVAFWWVTIATALVVGLILAVVVVMPWYQHRLWVEALSDEDPAVRAATIRSLPRGNKQLLIDALQDNDHDVRLLAVQRLGGEPWTLICLLKDTHAGVRREAAWTLSYGGPDIWPPVREALNEDDPRMRAGAALAIRYAYFHNHERPWPSRESKDIIPLLSKLQYDSDPDVKQNASLALQQIIP